MKLYDECILGAEQLLADFPVEPVPMTPGMDWKDMGNNQMIFQSDTAYELGGAGKPAVSSIALTDKEEFVPRDEIFLCGPDLPDITGNNPVARIAVIRVDEDAMGNGNALYQTVRKIEYTRYHCNPEGYMMRISAFSHREAVRVSKDALAKGLTFEKVGKLFIDAYKQQPQVQAVKLFFVTDPAFPYKELERIMERSEKITTALDHIMRDVKMDCHTCSLQDVCNEVEELYQKDFQK